MASRNHIFDDVAHVEKIQQVTIDVLLELHGGLAEIAKTPLLPGSALEMKSIAEQTLIKAHYISEKIGGKSNA